MTLARSSGGSGLAKPGPCSGSCRTTLVSMVNVALSALVTRMQAQFAHACMGLSLDLAQIGISGTGLVDV